jgi:hypothetical protein
MQGWPIDTDEAASQRESNCTVAAPATGPKLMLASSFTTAEKLDDAATLRAPNSSKYPLGQLHRPE